MTKFWRQGDLVFERVDGTFEFGARSLSKPGVLAVGGETGHLHTVQAQRLEAPSMLSGKEGYYTIKENESALIQLDKPTPVEHQEHATLLLPEGTYRVRHVGLPRRAMND